MYQKLNTKTLYWGFPIVVISSLNDKNKTDITPISSIYNVNDSIMIGLNISSKAYENIKLNKKAIINIVPDSMWSNIEKIAKYTAKKTNDQKTKNYIEDKTKEGNFNLLNSEHEIQFLEGTLLYIVVEYIDELVVNGIANICFNVKEIYVDAELLDENNYILDDKFNILLYQFRKYKKINKESMGKSFRYVKSN
ncbi:flavin reductase [Spiroplasma floricola]|uniref:Flavin reductase like domain-containing protein n=1 Tax=Spiroplasma floricola 23-6 TaxID=1336749 RepID=A0A2K8SCQ1_9MOLU|nr:flavin reductase [Spiroplasma floricola]AUB31239.1 hypothetical protein SFLOR_v1c01780 [Spiroplasma floricola 23-6]